MAVDSTVQEASQLALDEAGNRPVSLARPGQERLQMIGHDAVQNRLIGLAGGVRSAGLEVGGAV